MQGNIDMEGVIYDLLINNYGYDAVMNTGICFDDCIYSDRFMSAIESGLIPVIDSIEKSFTAKKYGEYHHFIYNDECYIMYFNN